MLIIIQLLSVFPVEYKMKFKHIILDATNYACQALLSKQKHYNSKGQDISMAMNFINKISMLEDRFGPEHIVFCWEGGKCLHRLEVYADYKATRPSIGGEGSESFLTTFGPMVHEMGYENFAIENKEGDDAIAEKARAYRSACTPCLVVSPDKDMLQLVSEDNLIQCFLPQKNKIVYAGNFHDHTGLPLGAFADYLVLMGDAGDNVPGVPGIAEVTAKWVLNEFGSIDTAMQKEQDIKLMAGSKGKSAASARRSLAIFTDEGQAIIERNRKLVVL